MRRNTLFGNNTNAVLFFSMMLFVAIVMTINAYLPITATNSLLPPVLGEEKNSLTAGLGEFYQTKSSDSNIHLMWLGKHKIGDMDGFPSAGYLIKTNENVILIDSSSLLDNNIDDIEKIDVILVTHTHGDHFIPESTAKLQKKTGAIVIANPAAYSMLQEDITSDSLFKMEPDATKKFSFGASTDKPKQIKIQSFLAEHPVKQPLVYLFEIDGFRIFHGADSGFVNSLYEISGDVHISLVPTGIPSPSASPQDAYQMVNATNPIVAYTMHGSESQNEEFLSLVQADNSLNTRSVTPKQYEILMPAEVVPEFPSTLLVVVVGIIIAVFITRYVQYEIDPYSKKAQIAK